MVTRGKWGGINWDIGIDIYTLLHIKQITNKDLLYSTNSTQYCNALCRVRIYKRVDICICITYSFAVHLNLTHCKSTMLLLRAQSCPTLCDPVDCSLLGSSVHGILQARILESVTISFSRGSSRPRDQMWVINQLSSNTNFLKNFLINKTLTKN